MLKATHLHALQDGLRFERRQQEEIQVVADVLAKHAAHNPAQAFAPGPRAQELPALSVLAAEDMQHVLVGLPPRLACEQPGDEADDDAQPGDQPPGQARDQACRQPEQIIHVFLSLFINTNVCLSPLSYLPSVMPVLEEGKHPVIYPCSGQNGRNIYHCVGHSRTISSKASYTRCVRQARATSLPLPFASSGKMGGKARR